MTKPIDHVPTVMIVEDSTDTRNVLSATLVEKGYRVVTAKDGEEAIKVAKRVQPNLILMDLNLPQMDGLAATQQIRKHEELSRVMILAITAYDTYGMKEAALEAGCDGYLTKPLDFQKLDKIVTRILNG